MNRYIRQMQLPDIGEEGQAKLARTHVIVIGAGGLGCPVLQYLVGAGIGRITLLDPDHVETGNLHRQPLYRTADVGRPKADAAQEVLAALNPGVEIHAEVRALTPDNAPGLVKMEDVVIDAADSFAVSYILSDTCLALKTPMISASVLGQTGYIGGFCGPAPSLRAVFPELPVSGATCATSGVLGPVVGMFGALQAQMAIRVVLGHQSGIMGQMITADLARMQFGGFDFTHSPEPERTVPFLSKNMLGHNDRIIELRDMDEAPCPIVPHAVRVARNELNALVPVKGPRTVLCCGSGLRAWQAARDLHQRGFERLALLAAKAC